ncbi:MAG: Gfo/Idh/MocA family protein [Bacteroidia bacterium]
MNNKNADLKVLVLGLGSMGKRRIRNLRANGVAHIFGFDLREDRRKEVQKVYQIPVFQSMEDACSQTSYDAWLISVPPDVHHIYIKEALRLNIPAFIEASVVDTDMEDLIKEAKSKKVFLAPSCTLFFHPAIRKIAEILAAKSLGKLSNILYHSGQYLPDWHNYEKVSDYYVSKKETGGAREIVPFELTWLTMLFGFPSRIMGIYKKTIDIAGAENIDDTYNLLLDYNEFIVNLSVDVVSRFGTRKLVVNGEKGQLLWDWNENVIRLYSADTSNWESIPYELIQAYNGYNKNITETMYNEEIEAFLNALLGKGLYPNTLVKDYKVLKVLYAVEKSNDTNTIQAFV